MNQFTEKQLETAKEVIYCLIDRAKQADNPVKEKILDSTIIMIERIND